MFVNPLEDLCDPRLVFLILKNPLPRRPLQHLAEFDDVIDEYPAQYQNQKYSAVALSAPSKALDHLP